MTIAAEVANKLHSVVDPELGIDVVELGLVYEILAEGGHLHVSMTTTSDHCPMGDIMLAAARACLASGWPDHHVSVEYTFEPRWSPAMISELGRDMLGLPPAA
ncbi:MAG: metal-sulfur cluster assembly factor [Dehalococcoidia bacterium]|nr:metal-sulfur cluster assembly factor [Dehalococcoidia bacterium]MCB9484566.1 metal-sulfur cluster assembly factor [Thermoflexaceae bacterium]